MHRPGTSYTGRSSDMPTDNLAPSSGETDGSDSIVVKVERYSPDPDDISPPQSPSSGRASVADSSAADYFASNNLLCGTPVIKQMEMMTRNYSDFMRSLAAKYNNNQHTQDTTNCTPSNGLLRNLDGTFKNPVISPIFTPTIDVVDNRRQSSPVMGDFQSLTEFPSSQTLLNLVRTASAHSALQLESYLRSSRKRPHEGDSKFDPLDLSVSPGKRNDCGSTSNTSELCYILPNRAGNNSECAENSARTKRTPSWLTLLDSRQNDQDVSAGNVLVKLANRVRSSSPCSNHSDNELSHWTVDDVVRFVTSIDSCNEYGEKFREQSIDGASLQLLNEEHLTVYLGMKLGPALKLRSAVSKLTGNCNVCMHCIHCHNDLAERTSRSPSVSK